MQSGAILPSGERLSEEVVSQEVQTRVGVPSGKMQSESQVASPEVQSEVEVLPGAVQSQAKAPSSEAKSKVTVPALRSRGSYKVATVKRKNCIIKVI